MLICATLDPIASAAAVGPLSITAGASTWTIGADNSAGTDGAAALAAALLAGTRPARPARAAVASLVAEPFELFRAVSGRRSEAQISRLDWNTDPAPYLPIFTRGPFRPPAVDVLE
jgi:hypothetical protein